MRDAYLVARLWNVSEEIFSHGIVAYCNELDFMSAQLRHWTNKCAVTTRYSA